MPGFGAAGAVRRPGPQMSKRRLDCQGAVRRRRDQVAKGSKGTPRRRNQSQTENDEPQPHVLFTDGLLNLNPEPWRPST